MPIRQYRNPGHKAPISHNVVTGTLSAGLASDLAAVGGTAVNVSEVTGAPGFDYRITIDGLGNLYGYSVKAYYAGSSAHEVRLEIYNNTTTAWDTLHEFTDDDRDFWSWYSGIVNETDYLNAGQVIIRFYHYTSGNTAHDLYVDYVSMKSYLEQL